MKHREVGWDTWTFCENVVEFESFLKAKLSHHSDGKYEYGITYHIKRFTKTWYKVITGYDERGNFLLSPVTLNDEIKRYRANIRHLEQSLELLTNTLK